MQNRDNIVIGILVIISYFLIVALFRTTSIVQNLGGMPLVDCIEHIVQNGNGGKVMATLVMDFAQMIVTIFVVIFTMNVIPNIPGRGAWRILTVLGSYIVVYLISLWAVRSIIFTEKMSQIIRVFIAIFISVLAGVGAMVTSFLRGMISRSSINNYLKDYLLDSRIVHWMADAFFVSTVILFLAVAIQMTVGLTYFFTAFFQGVPMLITILLMLVGIYYLIFVGRR